MLGVTYMLLLKPPFLICALNIKKQPHTCCLVLYLISLISRPSLLPVVDCFRYLSMHHNLVPFLWTRQVHTSRGSREAPSYNVMSSLKNTPYLSCRMGCGHARLCDTIYMSRMGCGHARLCDTIYMSRMGCGHARLCDIIYMNSQ